MDPDHGRRDAALTASACRSDAAGWRRRRGLIAVVLTLGVSAMTAETAPAQGRQPATVQAIDRDGGPDSSGRRRFVSTADSAG